MRVPCPQCQTVFNLPDNAATPGRKLRCAVCQNVFPLQINNNQTEGFTVNEYSSDYSSDKKFGGLNPKVKKILKIIFALLGLFTIILAVLFSLLTFTSILDSHKETICAFLPAPMVAMIMDEGAPLTEPVVGGQTSNEPVDRIGLLELRDMRQYIVTNEKVGKIAVVEGNVYNGFDRPRGSINLEASLYDAEKKLLFSKSQLAGTTVSLFQLQVLDQAELEASLTNPESVLLNNSRIEPGASVPFMILFYSPPESANEFGVRVTSADIINRPTFTPPENSEVDRPDPSIPPPNVPAPLVDPNAPAIPRPQAPSGVGSMDDLLKGSSIPAPPIPAPPIQTPPAQSVAPEALAPAQPVAPATQPPSMEQLLTPRTADSPPANMPSMEDLLKSN